MKTLKTISIHAKSTQRKAFTIAEILLTLLIIGVVAAITIPVIYNNYKKETTISAIKKSYTTLMQALISAETDNGTRGSWSISSTTDFFTTYLKPYLIITKDCGLSTYGECYYPIKKMDGDPAGQTSPRQRFYLNDTYIGIVPLTVDGGGNTFTMLEMDINGEKSPNICGKDVFFFVFYSQHSNSSLSGRLFPYGWNQSRATLRGTSGYGCNTAAPGQACAALIMHDNWQISDDYPW